MPQPVMAGVFLIALIFTLLGQCKGKSISIRVADGRFAPEVVAALPGDVLEFHFYSSGYSVSMGGFAEPCTPIDGEKERGFCSGVLVGGKEGIESYVFRVLVNDTDPFTFYSGVGAQCRTGGMAGVVNSDEATLSKYRDEAARESVPVRAEEKQMGPPYGGLLVEGCGCPPPPLTETTAVTAATVTSQPFLSLYSSSASFAPTVYGGGGGGYGPGSYISSSSAPQTLQTVSPVSPPPPLLSSSFFSGSSVFVPTTFIPWTVSSVVPQPSILSSTIVIESGLATSAGSVVPATSAGSVVSATSAGSVVSATSAGSVVSASSSTAAISGAAKKTLFGGAAKLIGLAIVHVVLYVCWGGVWVAFTC